jgi:hypothetical protein
MKGSSEFRTKGDMSDRACDFATVHMRRMTISKYFGIK